MPAKRNPLKPATQPEHLPRLKPLASITGKGEEFATGKGGGVLRFLDGELVATLPVPLMKQWTAEESALLVRASGQMNIPLESIPASDLSTLAAAVIQAMHQGQPETLRRLADIAESNGQPAPTFPAQILTDAIHAAAATARQVPTHEQVIEQLDSMRRSDPARFQSLPDFHKPQTLRRHLETLGFQWLPCRKRGRPSKGPKVEIQ